jgi:glycosyltransferase involved in cell wall biosynthesis
LAKFIRPNGSFDFLFRASNFTGSLGLFMRIAFDFGVFGWQKYGGISRYFFEVADNMVSANDVEAAIISPLYVNCYLAAASKNLQIRGQKVPIIRRTGRILRAVNELLAPHFLRNFQPDLVHETYYSVKRHAPNNCKVVLTVFDMIHERFPECFPSRDLTSKVKAIAVQRADHIVCISTHTQRDLIELFGVDPKKTSVVHLGFSLTKQSIVNELTSDNSFLLYVGSRGGYKNFDALLHAYASSPSLLREYELVAFGGGAFNAKERALIAALGIRNDRVRQINGGDAVLASLYRKAALFIYPSRYEGFGIPPLEAMSFDCPVVCSNTSSIPEVVGDAAEFFNPDSIDSMVQAIEHVLHDVRLRQTLVNRGRERVKLFSWERCAEKTLDIYRGLLR